MQKRIAHPRYPVPSFLLLIDLRHIKNLITLLYQLAVSPRLLADTTLSYRPSGNESTGLSGYKARIRRRTISTWNAAMTAIIIKISPNPPCSVG